MNDRELRSLLSSNEIRKGTFLHVNGDLFNVQGNIWAYYVSCAYFDPNDMWSPVHVAIKANFGDMGGWEEAVCFATDIQDYLNWEKDKSWQEDVQPQFHKKTHIFDKYREKEDEKPMQRFELNDVGHSILFTNKCPPGLELNLDRPLPPVEPTPPPIRLIRDGQIPKRPKPNKFPPDSYDDFPFKSHGTY